MIEHFGKHAFIYELATARMGPCHLLFGGATTQHRPSVISTPGFVDPWRRDGAHTHGQDG